MIKGPHITATEINLCQQEAAIRYQEIRERVIEPFVDTLVLGCHMHLWDIMVKPENISRKTTRSEWKLIDHWRRESQRRWRHRRSQQ